MTWCFRLGLWLMGGVVVDDAAHERESARLQHEAYQLGYAHGHGAGMVEGMNRAFSEVSRVVGERAPYGEVEFVDIALAKKGMVH